MFDLSWTELLVVAAVAIIVVGPKDLPRALRAVGRWSGKARRMARDFRRQFDEALREAELDTIKKEVESVGKIDPVGDMRKEVREIEAGLKVNEKAPTKRADEKVPTKPTQASEMAEIAADTGTDEPAPHPAPPVASPANAKP